MEFESVDENRLSLKDNPCYSSIFIKFGKNFQGRKEKKWDSVKEERKGGRKKERKKCCSYHFEKCHM